MKIVLDANLFASSLIKPDSVPGKVLDLVKQNQVELALSPPIIREIKRILLYPKISKYHHKSAQEIDLYFEDILIFAWMVEGSEPVDAIKLDPADNKYLACAYEAEADYIVSGDHHLLDLGKYRDIPVVTASEFMDIWTHSKNSLIWEIPCSLLQGSSKMNRRPYCIDTI